MVRHFAAEITKLRDEGLSFTFEGTTTVTVHKFDFYVMGDAKWVRLAYGLGGCASTYGCLYCWIKKNEIDDTLLRQKLGEGNDQPLSSMRSISLMRFQAGKAEIVKKKKEERGAATAAVKKEEDCKEEKKKSTKKGRSRSRRAKGKENAEPDDDPDPDPDSDPDHDHDGHRPGDDNRYDEKEEKKEKKITAGAATDVERKIKNFHPRPHGTWSRARGSHHQI